jgi:hypothetical protein
MIVDMSLMREDPKQALDNYIKLLHETSNPPLIGNSNIDGSNMMYGDPLPANFPKIENLRLHARLLEKNHNYMEAFRCRALLFLKKSLFIFIA